jgi:hypothetical protein
MVLIDTVYQRVLAIANKEQRGYITPQEFNLFADQAQHEILEQYFYDINQYNRNIPRNSSEYSDLTDLVDEKLSVFKRTATSVGVASGILDVTTITPPVYKIGTIYKSGQEIQGVTWSEYNKFLSSPFTVPSSSNRMYILNDTEGNNSDGIRIFPISTTNIDITYTTLPARPKWGYVVISATTSGLPNNEKALYDPSVGKTVNFELHASEETELVYKILRLAGVAIQRPDVAQAGMQFEGSQITQEKQ